ncbi:nucleolar transcription factor 1-like, partial [Odontomachus brunneus]|uniref:nucleolar transcription factor 1-like n=1 Tax=Odontomachus brunneus TaxID=486640 RepID=UPI0013F26AEE
MFYTVEYCRCQPEEMVWLSNPSPMFEEDQNMTRIYMEWLREILHDHDAYDPESSDGDENEIDVQSTNENIEAIDISSSEEEEEDDIDIADFDEEEEDNIEIIDIADSEEEG